MTLPSARGGAFAWGVRKNSPKLLADLNDFLKTHRQGTAFGQELLNRYTGGTYMLKQAVSESAMKQFEANRRSVSGNTRPNTTWIICS